MSYRESDYIEGRSACLAVVVKIGLKDLKGRSERFVIKQVDLLRLQVPARLRYMTLNNVGRAHSG